MGLLLKNEISKDCLMGIWEITEDLNELLSIHKFDDEDKKHFDNFTNKNRKLEWIATRILLKKLLSENKKIIYNKNGKPFLSDNSYKISISHSKKLVILILSKTHDVGIDIENILSERINKVRSKFLSEKEINSINLKNRTSQLYVYWCAKEALYKIFNEKNLNFKQNIFIEPFILKKRGSFKGNITIQKLTNKFLLNYLFLNNYVMVWCCK